MVTEMTLAGHSQSEIGAALGLTFSAIACRQKALHIEPAQKRLPLEMLAGWPAKRGAVLRHA